MCENTPAEMDRMTRKGMRGPAKTNGAERKAGDSEEGRRGGGKGSRGHLHAKFTRGSLYYREFPFGGYCARRKRLRTPVAFFPSSRSTRARARTPRAICSPRVYPRARAKRAPCDYKSELRRLSRSRRLRIYAAVYAAPEGKHRAVTNSEVHRAIFTAISDVYIYI